MKAHKGAEHHRSAARHHEEAAHHHLEAAKHHDFGHHQKAAHHARHACGAPQRGGLKAPRRGAWRLIKRAKAGGAV